jgi:hypothetical protein
MFRKFSYFFRNFIELSKKTTVDSALILIDGGGNRSTPPSIDDSMITYGRFYTSTTGGIFVVVKQIPNERLVFKNDWRDTRTEDGIIDMGSKSNFC